jgi:enamine deaminase RidA (YjgF/YER057c/UK114 family)
MTITALKQVAETPEQRLAAMNLTLPKAAGAVANYAPWIISNGVLYTSGQLPWIDGNILFKGRIGSTLSLEKGYDACKLSALNAVSQLKSALGDLSRVKRIIRLEGTMNVAMGFTDHPKALNGASDLINAVFGERGSCHTRMIYTNPEMPMDCTSLIVLWAEVEG